MTYDTFLASVLPDGRPPAGISPELRALWHAKAGNWEAAHDIAQDLPGAAGSWIHGLLHAIEGDFGNSAYWYRRAGRTPIRSEEVDTEWERIAHRLLADETPFCPESL